MISIMLDDILEALPTGRSSLLRYETDALVFSRGDIVQSLFILLAGEIKLSRTLKDGNELVLHHAVGSCFLAEASVYSLTYHCDAIALTPCKVSRVSKREFISLLAADPSLSFSWSAHLAKMLQSARQLSEIIRMKKVSERVDAWLQWHDGKLPPKGQWKGIAAQIGVSAEALYRELATRKG